MTKIRHHTLIVTRKEDGHCVGDCNKDWFVAKYCELFVVHHRIERPQGIFHAVSNVENLSLVLACELVESWIRGAISTIDLHEYSVPFRSERKRKW